MAFALTEARALPVDRDQRQQYEVGKYVGGFQRRLKNRPRPFLGRLANQEAKWILMIGEAGKAVVISFDLASSIAGIGLISPGRGQ